MGRDSCPALCWMRCSRYGLFADLWPCCTATARVVWSICRRWHLNTLRQGCARWWGKEIVSVSRSPASGERVNGPQESKGRVLPVRVSAPMPKRSGATWAANSITQARAVCKPRYAWTPAAIRFCKTPQGLTPEQWRDDPKAGNPAAETFNTRKQLRHRHASVRVRQSEGAHRWELAFWHGQREVDQWLGFPGDAITASGAVVDLTRDFTGARGNYSRDLVLGTTTARFNLGATWSSMDDRRRGYVNDFGVSGDLRRDEEGQVRSRDLHSVLEWQPAPYWNVTGGLRYSQLDFEVDDYFIVPPSEGSPGNPDDSGSKDYSDWSGALGVSREVGDWEFYAGTGRGFETPTLTEMAYRSEGSGLNTDLDAARNEQHEIGLRYGEPGVFYLDASLFWIDSRDELVVDRSEGGRTTYRNAGATERRGAELSGEWLLAPGWWTRYSVSYLDAEYSRGEWDGNRLPGIADTQLYAQLRWEPWLDPRLSLAVEGRHRSDVATGDENQTFAPSTTVWDFTVRRQHFCRHWRRYR